jgi:hypothetical protein
MAEQGRTCAKCGERPAGEGGVLCPTCHASLSDAMAGYWHERSVVDSSHGTVKSEKA